MYLTPSRYRAGGYGINVEDKTDAELRAVLTRASALADSYCAVPQLPSRHNFAGGSIVGEQHTWELGTETYKTTRRLYLNHPPVKEVTSFKVKFTNTYQVEILPVNLYINHIEGWAEVVSLSAVVSGMYPVGINFGLYTPVAEVNYTYGYEFTTTDDPMYVTDGNTFQASRGSWDTYEISQNGTVITTGFTVDTIEGEVTFDVAQPADTRVSASYTYTLPDALPEATGIIATHLFGEADLASKGMSGLSSIKVAEIALARTNRGMLSTQQAATIPESAAALLNNYVFRSLG